MPRIWAVEGRVIVEKVGRNTFLCKFKYQRDKIRILKGCPWIFYDLIILVEEPRGKCCISSFDFRYASFWIHFYKLPQVCFSRKYVEALGNAIGVFEEIDTNDKGNISGEDLRIRVRIDINEPLKRGTNIRVGSGAANTWVPVTYEKLLDFCYHCGKLDHVIQE